MKKSMKMVLTNMYIIDSIKILLSRIIPEVTDKISRKCDFRRVKISKKILILLPITIEVFECLALFLFICISFLSQLWSVFSSSSDIQNSEIFIKDRSASLNIALKVSLS